jgi:hypothetical protein
VIVDEVQSPAVHAFLSGCRLLMVNFPSAGACQADNLLEPQNIPPGWSKWINNYGFETTYRLFDENTGHLERHTQLPENLSEKQIPIFETHYAEDARTTRLFKAVKSRAETMPYGALPEPFTSFGISPRLVGHKISKCSEMPATDEATWDHIEPKIEEWAKELVRSGSDPAISILMVYLLFGISGKVARWSLKTIYELNAAIRERKTGNREAAFETIVDRAENLTDAAYRLSKDRAQFNVTGFFNATYFACLCAGTVMELGHFIEHEGSPYTAEQQKRLSRLRQNADELNAHVLLPSFNLPAIFTSREILSYVATQASILGREPEVEAKSARLHPGLTELLKDSTWSQLRDQEVHARYVQNVAPRPELSILTLVEREEGLFSCLAHRSIDTGTASTSAE